jgi:hypothetical protein
LDEYPSTCQHEKTASEPGNDLAVRHNFLQQNKDCECGNPEKIHDSTNEQKHHQRPTTAHTVDAVAYAERQSAAGITSEATVPRDECERRLTIE